MKFSGKLHAVNIYDTHISNFLENVPQFSTKNAINQLVFIYGKDVLV